MIAGKEEGPTKQVEEKLTAARKRTSRGPHLFMCPSFTEKEEKYTKDRKETLDSSENRRKNGGRDRSWWERQDKALMGELSSKE